MFILPLCFSFGQALSFYKGFSKISAPIMAFEMLQIAGVSQAPVAQQLQSFLKANGIDIQNVILEEALSDERRLYFQSLAQMGKLPTPQLFAQMSYRDMKFMPMAQKLEYVGNCNDPKEKARLLATILNLHGNLANISAEKFISTCFQEGWSVSAIIRDMFDERIRIAGGEDPQGPLAQAFRAIGIPESEILRCLPEFFLTSNQNFRPLKAVKVNPRENPFDEPTDTRGMKRKQESDESGARRQKPRL